MKLELKFAGIMNSDYWPGTSAANIYIYIYIYVAVDPRCTAAQLRINLQDEFLNENINGDSELADTLRACIHGDPAFYAMFDAIAALDIRNEYPFRDTPEDADAYAYFMIAEIDE